MRQLNICLLNRPKVETVARAQRRVLIETAGATHSAKEEARLSKICQGEVQFSMARPDHGHKKTAAQKQHAQAR